MAQGYKSKELPYYCAWCKGKEFENQMEYLEHKCIRNKK